MGEGWGIYEQLGRRTGKTLDADQIVNKHYLQEGEPPITGEERLKRIKANPDDIQLDAKAFMALWSEKGHTTLKWLYDTKGITFLSFWDTILQSPIDSLSVLYLYRSDDGSWYWHCGWLDNSWSAGDPASLLACLPQAGK